MTVNNTSYISGPYSGDGIVTAFAVSFEFALDAEVKVILKTAANVEVVQTLTSQYTLTGAGNDSGGTCTMITAPASGEVLTIIRDIPLTQLTDYPVGGAFPAADHEAALDKALTLHQQNQEQLDRTLRFRPSDVSDVAGYSKDIPVPNAGNFFRARTDALGFDFVAPADMPNVTVFTSTTKTDSVSTMKTTDIALGESVETISYLGGWAALSETPKGGAQYDIVTAAEFTAITSLGAPDEIGDHTLNNGSIAMLYKDNGIYVSQYGAVGDNVNDDNEEINAALSASVLTGFPLIFNRETTYKKSAQILIPAGTNGLTINANLAVINFDGVNDDLFEIGDSVTATKNIRINDLVINGSGTAEYATDTLQNGLKVNECQNIYFNNLRIANIARKGIIGDKGTSFWNGVVFDKLRVENTGDASCEIGRIGTVDDVTFTGYPMFLNGGKGLTTGLGAADAGVYIKAIELNIYGGEIAGMNNANGTNGYKNGANISCLGGIISGTHFENNCNDQSASYDLRLEGATGGLTISGTDHFGNHATAAESAIGAIEGSHVITTPRFNNGGTKSYDRGVVVQSAARIVLLNPITVGTFTTEVANISNGSSYYIDNHWHLPQVGGGFTGGNVGVFTCAAASSTVVSNDTITSNSIVSIMPTNAAAATLMAGADSLYHSANAAGVSFTVATAAAGAAAGTETFKYIVFN